MFGNLSKGRKSSEKIYFLKYVKILLKPREDVLNSFKSNIFPIMSDTTPRETSINEDFFVNEIKNDKKTQAMKCLMNILGIKTLLFW